MGHTAQDGLPKDESGKDGIHGRQDSEPNGIGTPRKTSKEDL
jgi:hypothetical protein